MNKKINEKMNQEMEEKMTEKTWTESICKKLNEEFVKDGVKLHAETAIKLPYSKEIVSFDKNWNPEYKKEDEYETDLLVYEETDNKRIPRVVIESKFKSVTTHDAIIYTEKATEHKEITPFLRYGIMIGDMGKPELPWRLISHGSDFDFMFAFKDENPSEQEWQNFYKLINSEVENSKELKELLDKKNNQTGIQYMQRKLCFN